MKNKILINNIILIFLICLTLTIIITFVDFSKQEEINYDKQTYTAYYLYDINSNPITLSYEMIELKKETDIKDVIKNIYTTFMSKINNNINLTDILVDKNTITIEVDKEPNLTNIEFDCLTNSITSINNIHSLIIKYQDSLITRTNNIKEYHINSPIKNDLYSYLYKDTNYSLVYKDIQDKEENMTIKKTTNNYTIYEFLDTEEKWTVKRDGLYKEDIKILQNNYKVNDTWQSKDKNITIKSIILQEDNTLLVTITLTSNQGTETIILKQGIGLYTYILEYNNKVIKNFKYIDKHFIKN